MRTLTLAEMNLVAGGWDSTDNPTNPGTNDPVAGRDPKNAFEALKDLASVMRAIGGVVGEYASTVIDVATGAGERAASDIDKHNTDTSKAIDCQSNGQGYDRDTQSCTDPQ